MKEFVYVDTPHPHFKRAKDIIAKYPEVKTLFGPYYFSAVLISAVVGLQVLIAAFAGDMPWWGILLTAYFVGAFANHSMFVMIHECCHNLVLKSSNANKWMGMICNIPIVLPCAVSFRNYHLLHHHYLGNYDYDADLASHWEAKWVGNSPVRKSIWLFFFFFFEGIVRPARLDKVKLWDRWVVINMLFETAVCGVIYYFFGPWALVYLCLSTLFSIGLHPLGARWIQEHYTVKEGQETFSYYGPLNKLTFNMGFHNEHHDLMMVPWNNLPKLKKMAPEFYEPLHAHYSWTKLLIRFIFDREMTLYSRIVHKENSKILNDEGQAITQEERIDGEHVFNTDSQLVLDQNYNATL